MVAMTKSRRALFLIHAIVLFTATAAFGAETMDAQTAMNTIIASASFPCLLLSGKDGTWAANPAFGKEPMKVNLALGGSGSMEVMLPAQGLSTAPRKFMTHCLRLLARLFVAHSSQISSRYAPCARLDPDPHPRRTGSVNSAARYLRGVHDQAGDFFEMCVVGH